MSAPLTPELHLDQLAARVSRMAEDCQLRTVPAMPVSPRENGWAVALGVEDLTAEDFIKLAAAAGARLLYVRAERFDADTYLDLDFFDENGPTDGGIPEAELAQIREQAKPFAGRIGAVQLGFAVTAVLHIWTVTEPWYDDLVAQVTRTAQPGSAFLSRQEALTLESRVARELLDLPGFRSAPTSTQRRRVAREGHPEIAAWENDPRYHHVANMAIFSAEATIREEAERAQLAMEERLPELASEFAGTSAWQNAGSARARREKARDFLAAQAGGYPPTTRLLELFLDTPPLQRRRPS